MSSEGKQTTAKQESVKRPLGVEVDEPQNQKKPRTLFPRTDVTLEVDGRHLHVNKQRLADNSSMFKKMFESDFKEKHMDTIPLPGKKYEDFETFLSSFYNPEFQPPITDETVLVILPLAAEYQVTEVQERCVTFLTQKLKQAINHESESIDIPTLLNYIEYGENYDLSTIVQLAVQLCARYDITVLKEAGVEKRVKEKMWKEILEERNSLMTTFMRKILEKGITADVFATLDLISGMVDTNQEDELIRTYEKKLSYMITDVKSMEGLVEIIIAGERFRLEKVLSSAIEYAAKCKSQKLKSRKRYYLISNETKSKIDEVRMQKKEEYTRYDNDVCLHCDDP